MSKSVIFGDVTVWLVLSGWPGAGCGGRGAGRAGRAGAGVGVAARGAGGRTGRNKAEQGNKG